MFSAIQELLYAAHKLPVLCETAFSVQSRCQNAVWSEDTKDLHNIVFQMSRPVQTE